VALDLVRLGFVSVLYKKSTLQKQPDVGEAVAIYQHLLTLPMSLRPSPLAHGAFRLAFEDSHSVYDRLCCALAPDRQIDFVTADQVLLTKLSTAMPLIRTCLEH
jgi:predicted nucleic acid-binding protein